MKTCPVCGARSFDDAVTCFGCLHHFEEWINEANPLEGEPPSKAQPVSAARTTRVSVVASGSASASPDARAFAQQDVSRASVRSSSGQAARGDSEAELALDVETPCGVEPQEEVVPLELYDDVAVASDQVTERIVSGALPSSLAISLPSWEEDADGWILQLEWTQPPAGVPAVSASSVASSAFGAGAEAAVERQDPGAESRAVPYGLVVRLRPPSQAPAARPSAKRGCHARVVASACVETSEEGVEP